ncbi:MAG TPA: D-alanine--D-alanine ligase family protein [Kiloniellaceae bacterium]|nr:D-alanine--D-alanine ligase family protein [Kiloniellaceae bacterium]
MARRQRIALLFGGQSAEHEVSIQSATNVSAALRKAGYDCILIAIDKAGIWRLAEAVAPPEAAWPKAVMLPGGGGEIVVFSEPQQRLKADVVFPVLHGPKGEDGSLQGLLTLAGVPFVGPGVLASALSMDKAFSKRLLQAAGIPTVPGFAFEAAAAVPFDDAVAELGLPLFVKPANMGSSVGVSKVHDAAGYAAAVAEAFRYDSKVVVESFADGQEIECAVLSLDGMQASLPGEIVPTSNDGFYSYDAKYVDADGAKLLVPAELPAATVRQVQALAIATARAMGCEGMVRVDFFLKADGTLLVNEPNTIPGFTAISMYPKLWEASGIPPEQLVVHLIDHALARFAREAALKSDRGSS